MAGRLLRHIPRHQSHDMESCSVELHANMAAPVTAPSSHEPRSSSAQTAPAGSQRRTQTPSQAPCQRARARFVGNCPKIARER